MRHELEYGPVAKGIFAALIAFFPVFAMVWPQHSGAYVFFLLFLLLGLRPLVVKSGLYRLWNDGRAGVEHQWDKKFLEQRAAQIDRKVKSEHYHKSRYRDPRLPKRW